MGLYTDKAGTRKGAYVTWSTGNIELKSRDKQEERQQKKRGKFIKLRGTDNPHFADLVTVEISAL